MDKLLARWGKENKYKHVNHCHDRRIHFSLFSLSVDGMLGKEALVVLTNLSQLVAEKLEEPISHLRGWFNGRISIAVVRLYSLMIRGACLPVPLRDREPDWDSVSGLGLAQYIMRQNNFAHTHAQFFFHLHDPALPPPSSAHCACYHWLRTRDNIWGPDHIRSCHSGRRKKYIYI